MKTTYQNPYNKRQYPNNGHCLVCGAFLTSPDANNTQYCNNPRHTTEMTSKYWYFDTLTGWTHK